METYIQGLKQEQKQDQGDQCRSPGLRFRLRFEFLWHLWHFSFYDISVFVTFGLVGLFEIWRSAIAKYDIFSIKNLENSHFKNLYNHCDHFFGINNLAGICLYGVKSFQRFYIGSTMDHCDHFFGTNYLAGQCLYGLKSFQNSAKVLLNIKIGGLQVPCALVRP